MKKQAIPETKPETGKLTLILSMMISLYYLGTSVLSSCGDLFVFYKKCLVQCTELSTGM